MPAPPAVLPRLRLDLIKKSVPRPVPTTRRSAGGNRDGEPDRLHHDRISWLTRPTTGSGRPGSRTSKVHPDFISAGRKIDGRKMEAKGPHTRL